MEFVTVVVFPVVTSTLFNAVMAEKYGEKGTQVVARILERLAEREIA